MSKLPVLRFAPSPNGYLHLGHALSAFVGHQLAQKLGGKFLIRIEDIDQGRTREAFVMAIFEDLEWLGLTWDPKILRQSRETQIYRRAATHLHELDLLYPCFATRSEIAIAATAGGREPQRDPDGAIVYPGLHRGMQKQERERRLAAGEKPAMRIRMDAALELAAKRLGGRPLTFRELHANGDMETIEAHPQRWGDAIVQRKDFPASYHLAVVVDDARQAVTHVTRGQDLFAASDIHRLLQVILDLPEPIYHHHRLIRNDGGIKLSKSAGAPSLRDLRNIGWTPAQVIEAISEGDTQNLCDFPVGND